MTVSLGKPAHAAQQRAHAAQPVNLAERFGKRYRITYDPAYHPKGKHAPDAWYMQIPCQYGTIYPIGGDNLAVEVDYHDVIAGKLKRLGLRLTQDGDNEKTFVFPVVRFAEVAAIVRPKRRIVLTERVFAKTGLPQDQLGFSRANMSFIIAT
jgi:hypothetical protein